jgi:hypothetical protein
MLVARAAQYRTVRFDPQLDSLEQRRAEMTRLQVTFLALSLTTFLTGCPIYGGDGDAGPRPSYCVGAAVGYGCPCTATSECDTGLRCDVTSGMCEFAPACLVDTDCLPSEICDPTSSICVPGVRPTACRTHGDCATGLYCEASVCTPSSTCTTDATCTGGFVCDFRDTCVPPGACRANADCTGTQLCIEGACIDPSTTCQFNYQCGAGRACVDNACVNICSGSAQCASGQSCQAGFCQTDPTECTTSASCTGGEHCVDGRCLPDCLTVTCAGASDACGADAFCRPTWEPRPFCTTDAQCALGSVCRGGVCRTPCPTMTGTECQTYDVQLPICQVASGSTEYLCYATNETVPECATRAECGTTQSCIDAICRNR